MSTRQQRRAAERAAARETIVSPEPGATTPDAALRARIADAVHRAVDARLVGGGAGACGIYALVGAHVLRRLGFEGYVPVAGEIVVACTAANDNGSVDCLQMSPAASGYSGGEFHAWIARRDGSEFVDLAFRHFPALAARSGITWTRPTPPSFGWVTGQPASELAALGILRVRADVRATSEMVRAINGSSDREIVADATDYALLILRGVTIVTPEGVL